MGLNLNAHTLNFNAHTHWLAKADALSPLTDAILRVSGAVVQAFLDFMSPIVAKVLDVLSALWKSFVDGVDLVIYKITDYFGEPQANVFSTFCNSLGSIITAFLALLGHIPTAVSNAVTMLAQLFSLFTDFLAYVWGAVTFALSPAIGTITMIKDAIGISIAWLNGTAYHTGRYYGSQSPWAGQEVIHDFTMMASFNFFGITGGKSIIALLAFFYAMLAIPFCATRMSLMPILAPFIVFKNIVMFMWNYIAHPILDVVIKFANFVRNIFSL